MFKVGDCATIIDIDKIYYSDIKWMDKYATKRECCMWQYGDIPRLNLEVVVIKVTTETNRLWKGVTNTITLYLVQDVNYRIYLIDGKGLQLIERT